MNTDVPWTNTQRVGKYFRYLSKSMFAYQKFELIFYFIKNVILTITKFYLIVIIFYILLYWICICKLKKIFIFYNYEFMTN
jgi:hypothetical protein